ncbi:hypothetical protein AB0W38_00325 [Aliarcobacter butzleri]|uniref:hypothetical protein n=1 Tax=Aliarcobacter butzleri TaxID=28197 RepID=UPI00344EAF71
MENENIVETIEDRLTEKDYNFDNVDRNVDNDFTAELDKLVEAVNNGEKVEDLDLQPLVEAGYTEKYDLTEAVQNMDNFAEEIKALEDSSNERIDNGLSNGDYAGFEFSENIAVMDSLDNDIKDTIMTREEGIEAALEAGVDIRDLAEITSESEVIEAARGSESFEVFDANEIQTEATERVAEMLSEDAKEFGIEIDRENLNDNVENGLNNDFSDPIDIVDQINGLDNENVEAFRVSTEEGMNEPEIIMSSEMSKEELVEAVAESLYEDNKEVLQERVNNGETFEETHDNRVELSEGKSEMTLEQAEASTEKSLEEAVKNFENALEAAANQFETNYNDNLEAIENAIMDKLAAEGHEQAIEVNKIEGLDQENLNFSFNEQLKNSATEILESENFSKENIESLVAEAYENGDLKDTLRSAYNTIYEIDKFGSVEIESPEVLDKLADIDNANIQISVMANDNTSLETLEKISNEGNADLLENGGIKEKLDSLIESKRESTQEINVEGDHATVKEQTMAGEESERVVDRETGLNEMDRAAGQDSDKVETREEHIERDEHLSVEEKEAKLVEIAETTKDPEVLDRLADTDSDKVIEAVKENENTSAETLDKIESKEESHEKSQGLSH